MATIATATTLTFASTGFATAVEAESGANTAIGAAATAPLTLGGSLLIGGAALGFAGAADMTNDCLEG